MDMNTCIKELIEKVATQGADINNIKQILGEIKVQYAETIKQQWGFIIALLGFLGKEIYFQIKNAINKRNGNGGTK